MPLRAHVPLVRVWAVAVAIFLVAASISRALARPATAMPSYWIGLIGLLAIGVALVMSWRGLGEPSVHAPMTRRVLRGLVAVGAILWIGAMVFPFL
jgi:hypothetical protein